MAAKRITKNASHAQFWVLIKDIPGYKDSYKDVIKEGLVSQYTGGNTSSLSEMFEKYPEAYANMIESLKGDAYRRQARYDVERDKMAKRVIAAICKWVDKLGYEFENDFRKLSYVKGIACRASNCSDFNKIPESSLSAIYALYCKRNKIGSAGADVDVNLCKN